MTKLNLNFTSITDLNNFHEYTDQVFIDHQKLIMNARFEDSYIQLSRLAVLLKQHAMDEETLLLPPYQERIQPEPPGGAVRFYQREHQQILRMMNTYITDLNLWRKNPPADVELVRRFDSYYKFKELLDHHDARERVFLYRMLDQKLSQQEKDVILAKFKHNMEKIIDEF